MCYKIETMVIKASFFSDVQNRIAKEIQPLLDAGAKRGWKLHTFQPTESTKGINICLIWEIPQ